MIAIISLAIENNLVYVFRYSSWSMIAIVSLAFENNFN